MIEYKVVALNKAANFNYEILRTEEAGIILSGTEVKSLRKQKTHLQESYVRCTKEGEIFIYNFHIPKYKEADRDNHDPIRIKKLLMHKKQIHKFMAGQAEKGLTIVPIRAFFNKKGLLKMQIGLARGKKIHDKRRDLKAKDLLRESRKESKDGII